MKASATCLLLSLISLPLHAMPAELAKELHDQTPEQAPSAPGYEVIFTPWEQGREVPMPGQALFGSASQGRSFLAVWMGDPPAVPELPSDGLLIPIDDISPGNWMVRGLGSPAPVVGVPAADHLGLLMLTALLVLAALVRFRH